MIQDELKIHLTDSINVYRITRVGNTESYGVSPILSGIDAQITPAGNDILALYPDVPVVQLFDCFIFQNDEIKNGDKFVSGAKSWIVRGVSYKIDGPLMIFQRIALQQIAV